MNKIDNASEYLENALKVLTGDFYNAAELNETSKRVAKVWSEMTEGVYKKAPNLKWFKSESKGFVIKGPIDLSFFCIHHLLLKILRLRGMQAIKYPQIRL